MNHDSLSGGGRRGGRSAGLLLFGILVLTTAAFGQQADGRWKGWQFLMGEWVGEGTGTPGEGSGGFSIMPDLQNTVLVRRNFANYAATKDRPAFSHEDLMVMYYENDKPKAIYFDNEKHVIRYSVEFSRDSSSLTFRSDPAPSGPSFRFTYTKSAGDVLKMAFDIAPPDKPDSFSRYIEASARRKQ